MVLAIGHALRAHEALSRSDTLPGFLEVVHSIFQDGVFVGHDRSIRAGILRSPYSFTFPCEHRDIVDALAAGRLRVEVEDFDISYDLYADGVKVASFAEGRVGYREWARRNGRLGEIHSLGDRYDHDVDELTGNSSLRSDYIWPRDIRDKIYGTPFREVSNAFMNNSG